MTELRPLTPGRLMVGGCPEGYDARHLAETIARASGPVIHVARDDARLASLRAALRFFAPELPVFSFPAWDCLPYDRISPGAEIAARRMATLAALVEDRLVKLRTLLEPGMRDDDDIALLSELLSLPSAATDLNLSPQRNGRNCSRRCSASSKPRRGTGRC